MRIIKTAEAKVTNAVINKNTCNLIFDNCHPEHVVHLSESAEAERVDSLYES